MYSVHEQCPQIVTQNSALSQNWVGCTPNGPWLLAYCALSRTQRTVTWPCPAVSRPPPGAPRTACLLSLLCACSGCCVPAQAAVCLFRLLCAYSSYCVPSQSAMCLLSLLCACSVGCVPARPAVWHNTIEPAVL